MFFVLEMIGTVAFAISGAMVGISKKMDIFGVCMLGMTTAVGGGILRDLIINVTPPMAFQNPVYALVSLGVSVITFLPFIRSRIHLDKMIPVIIDAVGLGVFTAVGVKAGMMYDNLFLEVFLGTVTGVGGGVLRDLFAAEKPMIFIKHIYACACIAGALLCALLYPLNGQIAVLSGIGITVLLRILAAKFKWHLPKA